ncbi:MAG: trypsin-like peptidase domain-containing protein [Firmicutes bacterium]|nr:trypsin-like peptidase domain-containing protein [Bacillota bacterium]
MDDYDDRKEQTTNTPTSNAQTTNTQTANTQSGYAQSGYAQPGYSRMSAYQNNTAQGAAGAGGAGMSGNSSQNNYYQHVYGTPVQGHPNYSYTKPKKESKPLTAKSVVAIVLSCALIFSSIGFGSAWMLSKALPGSASSSQSEAQLPDQLLERPENTVPGGDTENGSSSSQGSPIAGTADASRTTDLKLLTASAEEGALTTPEIVQKSQDSVVEIVTELVVTGNYFQQYTTSGAGSGVIITEDGYILTNNHVIKDASSITVTTSDGSSYDATLLGLDEQLDVALLKIDATGLKPATISTSSNLMVGQTVVAIGNPLGQLGGSVTQGIISALDRSITIEGQTMTLMQFDAAINPGNSGGGLFNAQGDLIGIVNAKSVGDDIDGIGFAIPIDKVMEIVDDLKTHGYVTGRVAIGVSLLDVASEQMAWMYRVNELGVYVYSVTDGSPAQQGGLNVGDRILSVNGVEVSSSSEVKAQVQSVSIGDTLTFVVSRNGHQVTLSVVAGEYVPEGVSTTTGQAALEDAA